MICHKSLEMIHLYVDGELDRAEAEEVQRHIDRCEDCKLRYRNQIALRSSLQDSSLYYRAPVELKRRIRSSLQQEGALPQKSDVGLGHSQYRER